jgi:hypothetical protein
MQYPIKRFQGGFTIAELLVVLGLTAILTIALFEIILVSKKNYFVADAYSKSQVSAHLALDALTKDINVAGYLGCINQPILPLEEDSLPETPITIMSILDTKDLEYNPILQSYNPGVYAIDNFKYDSSEYPDNFGGVKPVENTDVFSSTSAIETDIRLIADHLPEQTQLMVDGPFGQLSILGKGRVLMLTDCVRGHVFAMSNNPSNDEKIIAHNKEIEGAPDNLLDKLDYIYLSFASKIYIMQTVIYFIGKSELIDGQHSLYRYSSFEGKKPLELVPYVEDMQFIYGVDSNLNDEFNGPDAYQTLAQLKAKQVSMTSSVYTVTIDLVIASERKLEMGAVDGSNDGKLRKHYTEVVHLTNAGFSH